MVVKGESDPFVTNLSRIAFYISDGLFYLLHKKDFDGLKDSKSYDLTLDYINNLQKAGALADFLWEYIPDEGEHWQSARESVKRGFKGDCEDLAILLNTAFVNNGLEAYLLVMWGKNYDGEENGHATMYLPSSYTVGTFGRIYHGEGKSIADVAHYWYKELYGYSIYKVKEDGTWKLQEENISEEPLTEEIKNFLERVRRKIGLLDKLDMTLKNIK